MAKKNFFNDPRKTGSDFLTLDPKEMEMRENQMKMYEEWEVKVPKVGDILNVVYVGLNGGFFNFDHGFKDYIRVENKPSESKYLKNTKVGDMVDVYISHINESQYFITGSISEIYESKARTSLTNMEENEWVEVLVRELTPAGYNVDIIYEVVTLPGFMPNTLAGINKLAIPEEIINTKMRVMIESFSREEKTYIVSRRKYLQTLIPEAIKDLKYGHVYTGNVTGTTQFGIFVEFNECLTGMIHKTNANPELIVNFSKILPGMEIMFYIKEIIKDKIILTQVLRESLWDSIKIGQVINGKVKEMKSFGALIILDDETNGLIHTSELDKFGKKLSPDDEIKVKVIAVDRMNRKIFLTIS